jgi:hypothetical protein
MDLSTTDAIYKAARSARIEVSAISSPLISQFVSSLRRLYRDAGPERDHVVWRPLWRLLYSAQMYVLGSPIPPASWTRFRSSDLDYLTNASKQVATLFAGERELFNETLTTLMKILDHGDELPSVQLVANLCTEQPSALLLSSPYAVRDTQSYFAKSPSLARSPIFTASSLRTAPVKLPLVVVGPPAYFPDWIFSAPRARQTHVVTYDCVCSDLTFNRSFEFMAPRFHQSFPEVRRNALHEHARSTTEAFDPDDLMLPTASYISSSPGNRDAVEEVDSLLLILEADLGMWIEREGRPLVIVLDDDVQVSRIPAFQIEAGMFLLVRLDETDDYIAEVANSILGNRASKLRSLQSDWKEALRRKVSASGALSSILALLDLGSQLANETNLRNWMSPRSIKTQRREDFDAIMKFINWGDRAQEVWEAMTEINRAHRKAGRLVRSQLLEQVDQLDPILLESKGRMDFTVPNIGGKLTALRINWISPSTTAVPFSEIGRPFDFNGVAP